MATAAMIDDNLHIDRINPFTSTGTFGTTSNGGFYGGPDNTFIVERDECPTCLESDLDLSHFTPDHVNRSGPMIVNEVAPSTAPFMGFPARMFEYPDTVTTTWYRPGLNMVKEDAPSGCVATTIWDWNGHANKDQDFMIIIIIAILVLYFIRWVEF